MPRQECLHAHPRSTDGKVVSDPKDSRITLRLTNEGWSDGVGCQTFFAYYGFNPCSWKGEYQYNRVIDTVDGVFFQYLYGAGSLRADLDNDMLITPADFGLFIAGIAAAY